MYSANQTEYEVLGMPDSGTILSHVSRIFDESNPAPSESAAIELSELCSESPIDEKNAKIIIEDTFKLTEDGRNNLFNNSQLIGFIDGETSYTGGKLLFNGNLFRNNDVNKSYEILSSLSNLESEKIKEFNEILGKKGCINYTNGVTILGEELLRKMHSRCKSDWQ
ncbi:hypothetical protein [Serratia fonticola]